MDKAESHEDDKLDEEDKKKGKMMKKQNLKHQKNTHKKKWT